jgi:membrane fusion protein (multidrug efflux system)
MRNAAAVVGVLGVIFALGGVKAAEISKLISFGKKAQAEGPPPESVATARAEQQSWEVTISDVGTATPSKGVTLGSEAAGIVTRIHFESGDSVKQGDVLVDLDTNVERSQLGAAVARRKLASLNMDRTNALLATKAIAQAQADTDQTTLDVADQDVKALRAQLELRQVRAPFDGQLGIRAINVGQFLGPGAAITVLERVKPIFVDFTTPQERVSRIANGMPVRVAISADEKATRAGRIDAIEPAVDVTTRTVRLRASVPNDDNAIKPGMFVHVTVVLPEREEVVVVPASALVHASFGDSVYVVEDKPPNKIARQQLVRVGETRGDFVSIKEGLGAGQEVVAEGAFKLRNGARVTIHPASTPAPQLEPHPQNR